MKSGWPGFTRSPEIKTRSFSSYKEMLHGEWPGVSKTWIFLPPRLMTSPSETAHPNFPGGMVKVSGSNPSGKGIPSQVATKSLQPAE